MHRLRLCQKACPWHVPQYFESLEKTPLGAPNHPKMSKCDMCIDRLNAGLKPACVASCRAGRWNAARGRNEAASPGAVRTAPGFDREKAEITRPNIVFNPKSIRSRPWKRLVRKSGGVARGRGAHRENHSLWLLKGLGAENLRIARGCCAYLAEHEAGREAEVAGEFLRDSGSGTLDTAWAAVFGVGRGSVTPQQSVIEYGLSMEAPRDATRDFDASVRGDARENRGA